MAAILVVCTGNVCRSPVTEGLLRDALARRFGDRAPSVSSVGTAGWEGSGATRESVIAASELGVDISGHRARRLAPEHVRGTTLILAMAAEHREDVALLAPEAAGRTFTLKELVRLVEALPEPVAGADPSHGLATRVEEADALRRNGFEGDRGDEDVADPLGMPLRTYRRVAGELEEWSARLEDGLFGRATARAAAEGE
jgi:protein-tyrosine phosphatase